MRDFPYYRILTVVFFLAAVSLRLLLYWSNPPENTFDDHYEPIFLILEEEKLPAKDDCWECFQPPLFYLISAVYSKGFPGFAGSEQAQQLKSLQFLPALYGILTVGMVYLILKRIEMSNFARTLAFGMVCFLPRHIYMSAMHTNDTLSYLLVSLCVYLIFVAIDRRILVNDQVINPDKARAIDWRPKTVLLLFALIAAVLLALFSKSTALVLLPVIGALLVVLFAKGLLRFELSSMMLALLLFFIPLAAIGTAALADLRVYEKALPLNIELLDIHLRQPPGIDDLSFTSFKPWTTIKTPILAPENVTSFWTLIYSRMWFDMEPKFLQFTDPNEEWWEAYDHYLNRHDNHEWPGTIALSAFTRMTGSSLIALGLVPLLLMLTGVGRALWGKWSLWSKSNPVETVKAQVLLVLLFINVAGILYHTYRHPYYSFMKAAFVLNALPSMAVFLALGIMFGEKQKAFRWGVAAVFGIIFLLVTVHILVIVQALNVGMGQI